jgi:hypothetical protein
MDAICIYDLYQIYQPKGRENSSGLRGIFILIGAFSWRKDRPEDRASTIIICTKSDLGFRHP